MSTNKQSSRRQFFQRTGAAVTACVAGTYLSGMPQPALAEPLAPARKDRPFKLAMASYSLRKFSLDDALEMTASIGLDAICLKSMHLPLEVSDAEIAASVRQSERGRRPDLRRRCHHDEEPRRTCTERLTTPRQLA